MRKYNPENQPKAWLFLLPSLGVILLFNIYPLLRSFWMSFQKGSLLKLQYTGLDNYQKVIADPVFHKALLNTALYAFAVVPVALLISVIIAWIIFEKIKRKSFFETSSSCLTLQVQSLSGLCSVTSSMGTTELSTSSLA